FRGGVGTVHDIQFNGQRTVMNLIGERFKFQPYGLFGGRPAVNNDFLIHRRDGDGFVPIGHESGAACAGKLTGLPLHPGDVVRQVVAGGGGYGDPFDRDPEAVLADVKDGLVSPEAAGRDYGVAIVDGSDGPTVDQEQTAALRAAGSGEYQYAVNGVSVGRASFEHRQQHPAEEESGPAEENPVLAAKDNLDQAVCQKECPKKAHPKRCPFYNEEAISFWSLDAYGRWADRHCPQRGNIPLM
ncbi:MAG: hydantoinase B/oxoprolinase family protein, partial [Deltaproteobacteria bacterium]|nr:hydantoinase B/oxoprolinase family protein [Deltaproteobacteria bacterium]